MMTMNNTKTTADLANRGMVVRLSQHRMTECANGNGSSCYVALDSYVRDHHREIRAMLYGMIEHWRSQDRPMGNATHRFRNAAGVISGILESCGITGFLSNQEETLRDLNPATDDLYALYEAALVHCERSVETSGELFHLPALPKTTEEWLPMARQCGIAKSELASSKSEHGKASILGKRLSSLVNHPFSVEINDRNGTARLIREQLPHNKSGYWFAVTLDPEEGGETVTPETTAEVVAE